MVASLDVSLLQDNVLAPIWASKILEQTLGLSSLEGFVVHKLFQKRWMPMVAWHFVCMPPNSISCLQWRMQIA